jgi:hypothetical protein
MVVAEQEVVPFRVKCRNGLFPETVKKVADGSLRYYFIL